MEDKLKQAIKALDTNNLITSISIKDVGRYIDIKTNLFECYATYDDIVYFPAEFRLHSEKDIERNNIKRIRDTLDFIENNSDKINGILRVTLLHREIND